MIDAAAQIPDRAESGVKTDNSVSRRQALKRGALAGGALVWTVPLIQVVSLNQSQAEAASAPPGGGHIPPPQHEIPPAPHSVPPAAQSVRLDAPPTTESSPQAVAAHSQAVSPADTATGQAPNGTASPQAHSTLPFTGAALPVDKGIAAGAGLVAAGSVAAYLARRKPAESASADGPATDEG